ncbi:MAG TPA: tRNA (adenosine(37)-N6)-threonylcarbamoyltransferase complex ATPase subunit type 1 TsaE [Microvirga sp.]|nr:tRNA (adenosine(37)-N6)-threonylcarbamoyltransferase complex ATPase subunit type 1 TsaE [Microvirga sp.]
MVNGFSRSDARSGPAPAAPVQAVQERSAESAWTIPLADLAATEALARRIAEELKPGDLVALSGGLGAGKTALARAIVRALSGDPALEVPSPTFTLMQDYDTPKGAVVHADFYRLSGAQELHELGWDEVTDPAIALVEWPERAAEGLKSDRLAIALDLAGTGEGRVATLTASGAFAPRLAQWRALDTLLERSGWAEARRVPIFGDASVRAYLRLVRADGATAILMIAPPRLVGPPVRRGRPYTAIAKLAETVHAFVAMDRGLRALGFSAPAIYGEALEAGLLVIEDLGDGGVVDADGPIPERYGEATRLLARLHGQRELPTVLPVSEERDHALPPFDLEALLIEAELLLDWYMPHILGVRPSGSVRAEFVNLWSDALMEVVAAPPTWTLRDYHSPNLIWLPERQGLARVGLIDFQDAVLGHPAYDVASLLQDARVTVPAELELKLLGLYARERRAGDPAFDTAGFARAYAIMGAQRATKILGIFARLDKRDGKPQYLRHLPRIEAYLARDLAHPALERLKGWYDAVLPRLGAGAAEGEAR